MTTTTTPAVAPLLEAFAKQVPGVDHVVVSTGGGMVHANAPASERTRAEQLSALAAYLHGGAGRIAELMGCGEVEHLLVRGSRSGCLLAAPVSEEFRVAVLTSAEADVPQVSQRLKALAHTAAPLVEGGGR